MTEFSRRNLLRAGVVSAALVPFAAAAGPALAGTATPSLYRRARFTPLLDSGFTMVGESGPLTATLVRISNLPGSTAGAADRQFALTFRTAARGPAYGSYSVRRSGFTATTLFVVSSDAAHRYYRAVVNRSA
ncbi:MAG: hypothetical protein M3O55_02695 [Actinomycetota bacterium]|nr:hypothetical protein [Actinomycetota bacterium]